MVADSPSPVQIQDGLTVIPNISFVEEPDLDAFLIPGGFGTRHEMHNGRLYRYIRSLPEQCLLTSVCTVSWVYGKMGLLDGIAATSRKAPDRLAELAPACRISRNWDFICSEKRVMTKISLRR